MAKRKNKTILVAIVAIILVVSAIILNAPLDKQTIPTKFVVGGNGGFDLTPGRLNFGKIIPGSSASRGLTITNTYDQPTITTIKSSGAISEYIIVSKNNFILQPNESKNISFSARPDKDTEYGEYPGQIEIITEKA